MSAFKRAKRDVRGFMRNRYTDERLTMLLAHCRDEKFSFFSCCCFIGIPTADHALRPTNNCVRTPTDRHYLKSQDWSDSDYAERALAYLAHHANGNDPCSKTRDAKLIPRFDVACRRVLIPLIRAEIRRRDRLKLAAEYKAELAEVTT